MSDAEAGSPQLSVDGAIARVTLRRSAHRNRLHAEDLVTLVDHFKELDADPTIRVVVLDAEVLPGRPVFCSGFHIGDFDAGPPPVTLEDMMLALEALRPVTICALNGSVYGGACDFGLVCDITLGAEGIELREPAAAIGLYYHPTGLQRFVDRIGDRATRYLFLTAESVDAATLLRVGYLQEVWAAEQLPRRVDELARRVASLAPLSVEDLKVSIGEISAGTADVNELEGRMKRRLASEDFAEGRQAFAERRTPVWKGR